MEDISGSRARHYRALEAFGLFGLIPALIYGFDQRWAMLPALWCGGLIAYLWLRRQAGYTFAADWNGQAMWSGLSSVILRFLVIAPLLTGIVLRDDKMHLLGLPQARPGVWLLIMVLYPLLSVLPQEILFRSFFCRRYGGLISTKIGVVLISALTFGWAHVVLGNPVAMVLSAGGGILFMLTYTKHHCLALVCFEHALYGDFIFTIGLGPYFYHGTQGMGFAG